MILQQKFSIAFHAYMACEIGRRVQHEGQRRIKILQPKKQKTFYHMLETSLDAKESFCFGLSRLCPSHQIN